MVIQSFWVRCFGGGRAELGPKTLLWYLTMAPHRNYLYDMQRYTTYQRIYSHNVLFQKSKYSTAAYKEESNCVKKLTCSFTTLFISADGPSWSESEYQNISERDVFSLFYGIYCLYKNRNMPIVILYPSKWLLKVWKADNFTSVTSLVTLSTINHLFQQSTVSLIL